MTELEKLQHRVDLILPKLQNLRTSNNHGRDNFIYILERSILALTEDKDPREWSCGVNNIRMVCDIGGLNKYIDRAERFLAAHIR